VKVTVGSKLAAIWTASNAVIAKVNVGYATPPAGTVKAASSDKVTEPQRIAIRQLAFTAREEGFLTP
jgi:hypothetical protein